MRREVLSTSGRRAQNAFHSGYDAIGFFERGTSGHEVIENEAALVHLPEQIRTQIAKQT